MPPTACRDETLLRPGVMATVGLISAQSLVELLGATGDYWPAAGLLGLAAAAFAAARHARLPGGLAILLLFAAVGWANQVRFVRRDAASLDLLAPMAESAARLAVVQGTVRSIPRASKSGWTLQLAPGAVIESGGDRASLPSPIQVTIPRGVGLDTGPDRWVTGDRIAAIGGLSTLPLSRFQESDAGWVRESGAIAAVRARTLRWEPANGAVARFMRMGRSAALAVEVRTFDAMRGENAALLVAMMTGRTHHLSSPARDGFRRTGLAHLFSVSGLHTMLIGGLLALVLRAMGVPIGWRLIILAMALLFFGVMVGLRTAVLRAAVLLLLFELRELLGRNIEPLAALGTVCAAFLLLWPQALWQLDFQLTFLCLLAIVSVAPWRLALQKAIGRRFGWSLAGNVLNGMALVLLVSSAIQLLLTPIMLARFGQVSLLAPLANMLVLAPAGMMIKLGFLCHLVGMLHEGAGASALALLEWLVAGVRELSALLAEIPFAMLGDGPWPAWAAIAWMMVLLLGSWTLHRPPNKPPRPAWRFLPQALLLVLLIPAAQLRWPERGLVVEVLSVGQGDAILISHHGRHWLVDAGPPTSGRLLTELLHRRRIRHLEAVVATHGDADHIGGIPAVLDRFSVGAIYTNGEGARTGPFAGLAHDVRRRQLEVLVLRRGSEVPLGADGAIITVLHPTEEFLTTTPGRNAASLVLKVEYAGRSILLTGDAERTAEASMMQAGLDLRADVLLCGHHGSADSTTEPFLRAVSPSLAIASCGPFNRYGHPAPALQERLRAAGVPLLRTDLDGSIRLRITPSGQILRQLLPGALDLTVAESEL